MLVLCIFGFVGAAILLVLLIYVIVDGLKDRMWDDGNTIVTVICSGLFLLLLAMGIYNAVDGNQTYHVITKIYSLEKSSQFILGIGDGNYYYNTSEVNYQARIENVGTSITTLMQGDDIEYPYLLKHKDKWKDTEYYLHVPNNVKIIQYSVK